LSLALIVTALMAVALSHPAGTSARAAAGKTVNIKGFSFKPATLKVNRGARVAFANGSGVSHTATGGGFDTKRIAPGRSAAVRFNQKGTFAYHCKIHPSMKGKVIVE
jgi:plastocyanin